MGAGIVEGVKTAASEKIKSAVTKKFSEFRTEMWTFVTTDLSLINPTAAANLIRRQTDRQSTSPRTYGAHEAYKPMDENKFADILASVYKTMEIKYSDEQKREDERVEAFERMGMMSDEEFDGYIEGFNDDDLFQITKRIILEVRTIIEGIPGAATRVNEIGNTAAEGLAKGVDAITDSLKGNPVTVTKANAGYVKLGSSVKELLGFVWNKGNDVARNALLIFFGYLIGWFAVIFAMASYNLTVGTILMTILPVIIAAILIIPEPIIGIAILTAEQTKPLKRAIKTITFAQIAIGIYLSVIPIRSSPAQFLLLISLVAGIIFMTFTFSNKGHAAYRWGIIVLVGISLLITGSFLLGGKDATKNAGNILQQIPQAVASITEEKPFATFVIEKGATNQWVCDIPDGKSFSIKSDGPFFIFEGSGYRSAAKGLTPGTAHAQKGYANMGLYVSLTNGKTTIAGPVTINVYLK
ncbi:MAG: hypothetical protein PHG66_01525 [Candidatus Colwellbacteria bacterium]|nr:hypothetical protein [Candidatus Colwellbacteria bacterium]